MKFLRTLLIIVVVLAVIIGILSAIAPTKMSASRSIVINAPKEVVWNNASRFDNITKWSPWAKLDPNMKTSMEGTDGTVGAKASWDGNKDVGAGSQTFTKLEPMNEADQHLEFIRPFKGQADANMTLADTTGGVLVTWGFISTMPRPFNVMGLFMDPSEAIGKDYEKGLNNLKELSEQEATMKRSYRGYTINTVDQPMKSYVGKRETVSITDISKFFMTNLPKIGNDMKKAGITPAGPASGLYYTFDTVKMKTDMAAVFPVANSKTQLKGWESINVPSGKALEIDYYGAYNKVGTAYIAFDEYMGEKGLKSKSFVIEEYVTDPMAEKDTTKWLTKIYQYVE